MPTSEPPTCPCGWDATRGADAKQDATLSDNLTTLQRQGHRPGLWCSDTGTWSLTVHGWSSVFEAKQSWTFEGSLDGVVAKGVQWAERHPWPQKESESA